LAFAIEDDDVTNEYSVADIYDIARHTFSVAGKTHLDTSFVISELCKRFASDPSMRFIAIVSNDEESNHDGHQSEGHPPTGTLEHRKEFQQKLDEYKVELEKLRQESEHQIHLEKPPSRATQESNKEEEEV
jgi:hypothetical protein